MIHGFYGLGVHSAGARSGRRGPERRRCATCSAEPARGGLNRRTLRLCSSFRRSGCSSWCSSCIWLAAFGGLILGIAALISVARMPTEAFGPWWDNTRQTWLIGIAVGFVIPFGTLIAGIMWFTSGRAPLREGSRLRRPAVLGRAAQAGPPLPPPPGWPGYGPTPPAPTHLPHVSAPAARAGRSNRTTDLTRESLRCTHACGDLRRTRRYGRAALDRGRRPEAGRRRGADRRGRERGQPRRPVATHGFLPAAGRDHRRARARVQRAGERARQRRHRLVGRRRGLRPARRRRSGPAGRRARRPVHADARPGSTSPTPAACPRSPARSGPTWSRSPSSAPARCSSSTAARAASARSRSRSARRSARP